MIVAGVFMLCATPTWAVSNNNIYKDAAEVLTEKMVEKLDLNKEQENKIKKLNFEYITKNSELKTSNLGRGAKLAVTRKYHSEKKEKLKEILTDEQFEEYELALERLKKIAKRKYQNW